MKTIRKPRLLFLDQTNIELVVTTLFPPISSKSYHLEVLERFLRQQRIEREFAETAEEKAYKEDWESYTLRENMRVVRR